MTDSPPPRLTDWRGQAWAPGRGTPAAHPNARFTAPARQCPVIAPEWEDPRGVPISAILFGGRRASVVPLVHEARDWQHGTFLGSIMGSEKTAAATGRLGELRRDPMAMLPFCGYNMADYWAHWLRIGRKPGARLPRIYFVNWFRKSAGGDFLWPGFGDNSRVLKWIFERCEGTAKAVESPIGYLPAEDEIDRNGLDVSSEDLAELLHVDADDWLAEAKGIEAYYAGFGERTPPELRAQLRALVERLEAARS
jgi:phosphoenolpyruvate carboxykinase (GTP)